jgi:hypothetical protein
MIPTFSRAARPKMPRYYFDLRDGSRGYQDTTGVDLPDVQTAREYAQRVATELMKNREAQARHWRIHVQNERGEAVLDVPFIAHDLTLSHLSVQHRQAVHELSDRLHGLREAIEQARAVQLQARSLIAKSRGRPYLAADHGDGVLRFRQPSGRPSRSVA